MSDQAPAIWDKEAIKWLLKDPMKLQRRHACWQWVLERGGPKEAQRFLRTLPLPSDAARLLQVILDDPRQRATTYADRLNLSEPTYFRWLNDLVARLLVELNQSGASVPEPPSPPASTPQDKTTNTRHQPVFPHQASLFIGRDAEVLALRQLLCEPAVRLVTLTGPGGIGKTCLSIQAVRELGPAFADGIVFVSLAAIRDPDLLGSAIIQALGLERAGARPELELLLDHLRERELLLVLDNFEQLVAAAPLVIALLEGAPGLKILLTSRSILRVRGERTMLVPPLSTPQPLPAPDDAYVLEALAQYEAIRLFVDRAQNVRPDFQLTSVNAWAVAEICRRLDGMPLAIELAAACIRVLSPDSMVARLENRLALLIRGPRDLPPRQQTMRQTLDWSYELLSPSNQALFRQLSVFVGGWTFEAVCAVCQLEEEHVLLGLAELIDQSMIQAYEQPDGESRFTMLETIREYGEEQLAQSDDDAALRLRHAAYYLSLAEAAEPELSSGPRQKYWHDRLQSEYDNIRVALSWCQSGHELEQLELGVRLAAALWKFWLSYSYVPEGGKWLAPALSQSAGWETPARCKILYGMGWFVYMVGDYARGKVLFEEALALARQINFRRGIGMALHGVGEVLTIRGEQEAAKRCFVESLDIFRALEDREETGWALYNLGRLRQGEGDVGAARRLLEESAALFRVVDQQRGLFWALSLLASVQPEQTNQQLEDSLAWFRELDDRLSMAWALYMLGVRALDQGQLAQAGDHIAEALTLFRSAGEKQGRALTLCCAGHVAFDSARFDEAARCYIDSLALQYELGFPGGIAECLEGLAALALRQGAAERAALLYGAAEGLLQTSHAWREAHALRRSQSTLALLRAALAPTAFDAAFAAGQATPLEEIVREASRAW